MFHKVIAVNTLTDFQISVQFAEGVTKIYDMKPVIAELPALMLLQQDEVLFQSVAVDAGGYGIIWNDDLDLSCDALWDAGGRANDKV